MIFTIARLFWTFPYPWFAPGGITPFEYRYPFHDNQGNSGYKRANQVASHLNGQFK
jgi:hypothetical protein